MGDYYQQDSGISDDEQSVTSDLGKELSKISLTNSNKAMTSPTEEFHGYSEGPSQTTKGNLKVSDSVQVSENDQNGSKTNCTTEAQNIASRTYAGTGPSATDDGIAQAPGTGGQADGASLGPGVERQRIDENNQKEPTISCLDHNDIVKLGYDLNPDKGSMLKNWRHLARECGIPEEERDAIARAYSGGGNPSLEFFKRLRNRNNVGDVGGLIEKLKTMERNDCVLFVNQNIENLSTQIRDLSEDILENLANKLTEKGPMLGSWKDLASSYGFSRTSINNIQSTIKTPGEYNPTYLLFEKLIARDPGMKISSLIDILRKMERNDVGNELEEIARNKNNSK